MSAKRTGTRISKITCAIFGHRSRWRSQDRSNRFSKGEQYCQRCRSVLLVVRNMFIDP